MKKLHSWSTLAIEKSPYCIAQVHVITNDKNEPIDYMYVNVNIAYCEVTGMRKEELIGKRAGEIVRRITSSGFDWISFIGRVGLYTSYDETIQAVSENGNYIHIVAHQIEKGEVFFSFIDTTQLIKRIELHEHLFDLTPIPIVVLSPEGIILKANQEWVNVFNYTPEFLKNKSIFDFIHPEGKESLQEYLEFEDKARYSKNLFNRMKTNDDSYKEISWRAYHTNDYILAAGVDVTQMKEKERALKRQIEIHSMFMNTTITGLFQAMFDEPLDPGTHSFFHESIDMYLAKVRIVSLNQAFADQYHGTKEALLGRTLLNFFLEDLQTVRKLFIKSLSSGRIYGEVRMKLLDGSFSYFFVDITTLKDSRGRIVGLVGLQVDINERKKSEEALQRSEAKFRLLAEYASDMIWVFNLQTYKFTYFSPSVHRVLGWSVEEIKESDYTKTMFRADAQVAYQRINAWIREFKNTKKVNRNWTLQIRHYKKDGHLVWIESSINFKENDDGVIEVIGVSRDISDKKRAEADLLYSNYHDQLTNVYNRRYIEEQLSTIIDNSEFPIAIVTCDINGLKLTNDVFGHATGDDLLSHTGALLQSFANEHDIVAREGGDEFLMILSHTTKEQAEQRVSLIKEKGSTILVKKVSISLSIGVAIMEHKDDSFEEVYALSEHYLYRNKLVESSKFKEQIIMFLMSNLFEKYPHLLIHCEHVASLSKLLAIELGLDEHDVNEIYIAGKLHDIGKIGFEDNLIHPIQPITETQQFLLQRHSELGFNILKSAQHYGKIADWVLSHHEQPDGNGYPRGLKKHQIPLQSHILHVATAFDSVMSENRYSNKYINTAIQLLVERKCTMYDDRVLDALESLSIRSIEVLKEVLSWADQKN